jgi:hypothetical protein
MNCGELGAVFDSMSREGFHLRRGFGGQISGAVGGVSSEKTGRGSPS